MESSFLTVFKKMLSNFFDQTKRSYISLHKISVRDIHNKVVNEVKVYLNSIYFDKT